MPWKRSSLDDMIGVRYGNLTVIEEVPTPKNALRKIRCKCDCGNTAVFFVQNVKRGMSKSCACHFMRQRISEKQKLKSHGMTKTTEYRAWSSMLTRCTNPKSSQYHNYGGRGITVCERWCKFEAFFADMGLRPGDKHSIDRIDTNGDYTPENCRWATWHEQAYNRRNTKWVTFNGETLSVGEWAKRIGLKRATLYYRIYFAKWSIEDALTTPKLSSGHR